MKNSVSKYNGIFPALITPYTKDGLVNEDSLRRIVSRCIEKGVKGFYVCGSTAEAFMLTTNERKRILEIVADENKGSTTIISHVGSISTDVSIELAEHAKEVGVDAISSVPPFYYGFKESEIVSHYLNIAESVDVPFILYNFPAYSGFTITPDFITDLRIRNDRFIGLKHTSMNLYHMQQMLQLKDFIVFSGHDEVLAGALIMGAHGAIGSTYNLMPEIYIEIMEAVNCGDIKRAQNLQNKVNRFINLMTDGTGIPEIKYALEICAGIESNGCRKPIGEISNEKKKLIESILTDIELL